VSSVAVDVRPEHDVLSTAIVLRGGEPDEVQLAQRGASVPGGSLSFLTIVEFVDGGGA
jgi:hypothetical protein